MSAPLKGTRVIEIGNYLAAPFAGAQLADLGADVVKVENPRTGDYVRSSGPFVRGESSPFARLNRNKRSLALDMKSQDGREVLTRLISTADVLIENLRPGTMDKLGYGWEETSALNPRLVYVSASGWGSRGPLARQPGLDVMAQARSGIMSITGTPEGEPVKVGVPICDMVCALYGALGAVSALQERARTGRGQRVEVSLFEAGASLAIWEAGRYFAGEEVAGPMGSAHQSLAPYQAVACADGWFAVGATTPPTWASFCAALGLGHLADHPDYADVDSRFRHRAALMAAVEEVTAGQPQEHWIEVLSGAGVPCAPIQRYEQVFHDEQLLAADYFWDAEHPVMGTVRHLGSPMHFSAGGTERRASGPLLGEHTGEILRDLGFGPERIAAFAARGTTGGPVADGRLTA
ncbi:CaiB/BaiF CoA transferase family protein [Streptomyces sp. NPDC050560]|uniref:CaiB/BaiF CoA transferase family protein n=1 Tax=Streptomyces sp. NPDC050560 TaxID=3365630 RepID=UPI0037B4437A